MYHLYTDMPLIEGVGDEVTVVFTLFLLFLILCIAWVSTNIQELPFFSVIVIEFTRRQNRNQQQVNNVETSEISSASSSSSEESTGEQAVQEEPENVANSISKESSEQTSGATSQVPVPVDANEDQDKPNSENHEEGSTEDTSGEIIQQETDDPPVTENELRRRRVAFFSGKSGSSELEQGQSEQKSETKVCEESLSNSCTSDIHAKTKSESRGLESEKRDDDIPRSTTNESDISSDSISSQNDKVRIRLKYLNETQRNVEASLEDTVDQFRRTHFSEELAANKLVRFIFNGQDLRNDTNTLQAYNIVDNSVIHCLITQANRQTSAPVGDSDGEGFDVGMLMLPCFGLILLFMWYLRLEFKQFFSGTSTVCLIGITLLYIAAILATLENRRRGHNHIHVN